MPEFIDLEMDGGDFGPATLAWRLENGEPVFLGLECGRGLMEPRDAIDWLWNVVPYQPTFAAHQAAVKRWIDARGWDALEARASAKDAADCEAYHVHSEQAA